MDMSLLSLLVLVSVALIATLWKGRWQLLISGFKQSGNLVRQVWLRLILGFTLGGLIKVLIPSSMIMEWLGPTSGFKGILIASAAGALITGGPYVSLPIVTSLYTAGAGVGPVIAFLVAVPSLSLPNLFTWHIPFLGTRIALSRYIVGIFIPPVVGLAGGAIYQLIIAV